MIEKLNEEHFIGNGLSVVMKQTEPPQRFTEASLVKELQKRDVGRP
jgi:DNA topoisomerase IA